MGVRFSVDPWDPSYGGSVETDLDPSEVVVDAETEVAPDAWGPIEVAADPAPEVLFVDGVRRIDARVWITDDEGVSDPGVCASYAAGVVRAGERAEVVQTAVRRGVFSASRAMRPIDTHHAGVAYRAHAAADGSPEALWIAIQEQMARRRDRDGRCRATRGRRRRPRAPRRPGHQPHPHRRRGRRHQDPRHRVPAPRAAPDGRRPPGAVPHADVHHRRPGEPALLVRATARRSGRAVGRGGAVRVRRVAHAGRARSCSRRR